MKIEAKSQVRAVAILFAITYMVSYITRINYGAIVSEMENATEMSKSMLSLALTGSFITYGIGQIITGICGDKFSPKKLITLGLFVTTVSNLLIPICQNHYQMLAVWCINGFAQAFMWPPLVRLMTVLLSEDDYKKTTTVVSYGSSVGTILIYLAAPLIISLLSWKFVFVFSAACSVIMIIVWNIFAPDIEKNPVKEIKPEVEEKNTKASFAALFSPVMILIMVAVVLQGALRDGITTWMPSYISETYNMSSIVSILTGVILPVFSILCFITVTAIYRKVLKSPILCATILFGIGAVSAFVLFLVSGNNAVLSVILSALLAGCMHGVNLMLVCMIPPFFKKFGIVSTASGVINSCTYIGSALSTYGIAVLSEFIGWQNTIFIWFIITVMGGIICLLSIPTWNKKFGE